VDQRTYTRADATALSRQGTIASEYRTGPARAFITIRMMVRRGSLIPCIHHKFSKKTHCYVEEFIFFRRILWNFIEEKLANRIFVLM